MASMKIFHQVSQERDIKTTKSTTFQLYEGAAPGSFQERELVE